jgi:hypothetical protein
VGGGSKAQVSLESLPPAVRDVARAVGPLLVYRSDEALARMEWVEDAEIAR